MKKHAIIEVEEGTLTLTVGSYSMGRVQVHHCERHPLPETTKDTVAAVLANLPASELSGVGGVRVILGDRRAYHFVASVPRLKPKEVLEFVGRECCRATGAASQEDLHIAPRILKGRRKGQMSAAASALPRSAWMGIGRAFAAKEIEVTGLYTMESCLALAARSEPDVAVVECSGGRARFVLCDRSAPAQVRRFILGGGMDSSPMGVVSQLALELPRTLDWLRENGLPRPRRLVITHRLPLDEASREMLGGEFDALEQPQFSEVLVAEGEDPPGLATMMLLMAIGRDDQIPSLLDEPRVRVPWSARRVLTIAAAALVGFGASAWTVRLYGSAREIRARIADVERENVELAEEFEIVDFMAVPLGEVAVENEKLEEALRMRRPVSRLVADVSNGTPEAVRLEKLQFASTGHVVVSGTVAGTDRRSSLNILADFSQSLLSIPYLEPGGGDKVTDHVKGGGNLNFELDLQWRRQ